MSVAMMKIDLPANAYNIFQMVIHILIFDVLDVVPLEDWIQFSWTDSVDPQLEVMGFDS